jgi:ankyrin repeat protein
VHECENIIKTSDFYNNNSNDDWIYFAVVYNEDKMIDYFLQNKLNPNTNIKGVSLLTHAIQYGNADTVAVLLKHNALVSSADIAFAFYFGHQDIVRQLLLQLSDADPARMGALPVFIHLHDDEYVYIARIPHRKSRYTLNTEVSASRYH